MSGVREEEERERGRGAGEEAGRRGRRLRLTGSDGATGSDGGRGRGRGRGRWVGERGRSRASGPAPGPGPSPDSAPGPGPGSDAELSDVERELRVLLERAVPRLGAPEERLRRVRERAARSRRRRRVAGTSAAAVAGLVVAGTLLPGFLRGATDEGAPPASPAPTVTDASAPDGRAVRFPYLYGLTLRLPPGWQALAVPADPALGLQPRGIVASRRIPATAAPTCAPKPGTDCDPARTLGPGEVLVTLDRAKFGGLHTKTQDPPELYALDGPSALCRKLLGTEEYGALLAGPDPGVDLGIQVSVCAAGADASSRILDHVRDMIAGADYPAQRASPAPTTAPPTPAN